MVLTDNREECYICKQWGWIENHHIFGSYNKKNSEKYGFIVPLCHACHNEPPNGIHYNKKNRKKLQGIAREYFIENIGTLEEFIKIFVKSYL